MPEKAKNQNQSKLFNCQPVQDYNLPNQTYEAAEAETEQYEPLVSRYRAWKYKKC